VSRASTRILLIGLVLPVQEQVHRPLLRAPSDTQSAVRLYCMAHWVVAAARSQWRWEWERDDKQEFSGHTQAATGHKGSTEPKRSLAIRGPGQAAERYREPGSRPEVWG
jgi:hypothetical protein